MKKRKIAHYLLLSTLVLSSFSGTASVLAEESYRSGENNSKVVAEKVAAPIESDSPQSRAGENLLKNPKLIATPGNPIQDWKTEWAPKYNLDSAVYDTGGLSNTGITPSSTDWFEAKNTSRIGYAYFPSSSTFGVVLMPKDGQPAHSIISQTIDTIPGEEYTVSLDLLTVNQNWVSATSASVYNGTASTGAGAIAGENLINGVGSNASDYKNNKFTFTAKGTKSTLSIRTRDEGTSVQPKYMYYKNISVVKVNTQAAVNIQYVDYATKEVIGNSPPYLARIGDLFTMTASSIPGYNLRGASSQTIKVAESGNLITFYYDRIQTATVNVRYLDYITNAAVRTGTTANAIVGSSYTAKAPAVPGYSLRSSDSQSVTVSSGGNTITFFYDKRVSAPVTVIYKDTEGNVLDTASLTGNWGDTWRSERKVFAGYEVLDTPAYETGVFRETPLTIEYVYKKLAPGDVIVSYLDEDGNDISDAKALSGLHGTPYTSQAITIEGFELVTTPANASGLFNQDEVTMVNYIYKRLDGAPVTVKFIDTEGNELQSPNVLPAGKFGTAYEAEHADITGYTLKEVPDNENGFFTMSPQTVTYVYEALDGGNVTVNYVDQNGTLLDSETKEGKFGSAYTTESKTFNGYDFVGFEGAPAEGSFTLEDQTVIYTYQAQQSAPITVNYQDTKGNLLESYMIDNLLFGENYETSPIEKEGYVLKTTPSNASGTATLEAQTVTYVYDEDIQLVAPTINPYFTTDSYARGTVTGNAKQVGIFIDGVLKRTAAVVDGKYEIYTGNFGLTTPGQKFEVAVIDGDKTGPKTIGTVLMKPNLVAPVIDPYFTTNAYANGTVGGDATQVAIFVNGVQKRTAAVSNGRFSIYTGDLGLTTPGQTFEIVPLKDGLTGPKAIGTVLSKPTLVAPTINSYYTSDVYARGTVGGDATQVAIFINGVQRRTAAVTNGKYEIYTGDLGLTTAGQKFEIAAIKDKVIGPKTETTVLENIQLVAPTINDYYTTDAYASGTVDGDAKQVAIFINGVQRRTAAVTDGKYTIYTGDLGLTTVGKIFEIAAVNGNIVGPKATGIVIAKPSLLAPTINPYYTTDAYASGTVGGDAKQVAIFINGVQRRTAAVTDGKYTIYTGDLGLTNAGDIFEIAAVNGSLIGPKTRATVLPKIVLVAPTINDYYTTDAYASGTVVGDAKQVAIFINGVQRRTAAVTDGKYTIYTGDLGLTKAGQTFEIAAINQGTVGPKRTGVVKDKALINLTADEYVVGQDTMVEGMRGLGIDRVFLVIDGVEVRSNRPTTGNYQLYAADAIKTVGQSVEVVGKDADGKVVNRVKVNLVDIPVTPITITPNEYTLGEDLVTGTISSNVVRVALLVDGEIVRQTATTGTTFAIWAKDKITAENKENITLIAIDAKGNVVDVEVIVIDKAMTALTAEDYTVGKDAMVEGTRGSGIARVFLYVDGVEVRSNRPTTENYQLYAEDAIKATTQRVEVVGRDANGKDVNRITVRLI